MKPLIYGALTGAAISLPLIFFVWKAPAPLRNGRYQLFSSASEPAVTILLNTATGETWARCASSTAKTPEWCAMPRGGTLTALGNPGR